MIYAVKLALSALIIVAAGELSKRSPAWASLLIALPLVTIVSFGLIYLESRDKLKIAAMSYDIFWLVLPSLGFLLLLPSLLKRMDFWPSLLLSMAALALSYAAWFRFKP